MFPFLDLKIIKIPMYGLCIVIGIALAALIAKFLIKQINKNYLDFIILTACAFGVGMVFAKLLYIAVSFPLKDFFKVLWAMISGANRELMSSGFVFYGGVIGGVLGYFIGTKIAKCKFDDFTDVFGVLIPFAHAFGRIGCFCGGCCYGIPYEGPFSVVYKNPITSVPAGIGIFPVQLLESLLEFILSFVLFLLFRKGHKHLLPAYFIFYGIIRFCTEFLRGDVERGFVFGWLSTSQFISIVLIVLSVAYLIVMAVLKKRKIDNK